MPLNIAVGASPVSGYRLLRLLGEGGFGQVWEAEAPGGLRVAMKFIRMDNGQADPELRALDTIRHARHPHLLDLHYAMQVENYLVIATSLCDMNLFDRFKECRDQGLPGIPPEELLRYMHESATAIDFLNEPRHLDENGQKVSIQHRDIKPLNLFLVGDSIKVADFGLAKVLSHRTTGQTGSLTPHYAAPERIDGQIAMSSDQYSLAVTYCELRTGTLPFNGSVYEVIYGHMKNEPNLDALPEGERNVIRRALSKDPDARWYNCREFVNQLKQPIQTAVAAGDAQRVPTGTLPGWGPGQNPHLERIDESNRDSQGASSETESRPKRNWSSRGRRNRKAWLAPFAVLLVLLLLLAAAGVAYIAADRGAVRIALVDPPAEIEHVELDGQKMTLEELARIEQLSPGWHYLQITGAGFEEISQGFTIQRGENPNLRVKFVRSKDLADATDPHTNSTVATTHPHPEHEDVDSDSDSENVPVPPQPAVFRLVINPPTAEIAVLDGEADVVESFADERLNQQNGNERIVTVPIGESEAESTLTISATLDGYEPLERKLVAEAGRIETIALNLVPLPAVYKVRVTPAEAKVTLQGLTGEVDGSGKTTQVKVLQPDGSTPITIMASLTGYQPAKLQFIPQPGESRQQEMRLKALPASLQLNVTPANAILRVEPDRAQILSRSSGNGATRTLTVTDPEQLQNVKVTASLAGYESAEFSWSVKLGEKRSHMFDLIPHPAVLDVTVDPPSAKLTATPASAKITAEGARHKFVLDRPDRIQTVIVLVTQEGYESREYEWLPTPGSESQQTLSLALKPVTLTLTLEPADAELQITPAGASITGTGATKTISATPSSGPFEIVAGHGGFESEKLTWAPEINRSFEYRIKLVPIKLAEPSPLVVPFDAQTAERAQQQWALYTQTEISSTNSIGVKFVLIPPGKFTIGLPVDAGRRANAIPAQEAIVEKPFSLSITEVTQAQWIQVMGTQPWAEANLNTGDNYPAVYISWNDAQEFCRKLTELEASPPNNSPKTRYRLPTEAEWEWACRAGSSGRYTCPDSEIEQHAWFTFSNGNIHQVAKLAANRFGLFDMHGNVSEWCGDIFPRKDLRIVTPDPGGEKSILRGGSWDRTATYIQTAARDSFVRDYRSKSFGFRIVQTY